jgi:hypothetical protein
MSIQIRVFPGQLIKYGLLALLVAGVLLSAGCIGPFEPASPQQTPGEPMTTEPTPGVTVSPEQTAVQPLRNTPTDLPAAGYIERSYGYVPYSPPPEYRLTMIESNSKRDASGHVIIYGRVKNEGPGSLVYLQMTFNLFDSSGNLVGNAYAKVEYFGSGKTWWFESDPVSVPNYQYFEISSILAQ